MEKSICIICARNLSLAGRVQKFITSFQDCLDVVIIYDFSSVNSSDFAESINVDYCYNGLKTYKYSLINFLSTIKSNVMIGRLIASRSSDFLFCHDLPTLWAGYIAKQRSGAVLIYDASELAVERYAGFKKAFWSLSLRIMLPHCDKIIHANKERADYFNKKHDVEDSRSVVISNYPKMVVKSLPKSCVNPYRVLYFGTVIRNRSYEQLIAVFKKLPEPYGLDIIGNVNPKYRKVVEDCIGESSDRVRLLPPVTQDRIPKTLSLYTIGLIFYEPVNLNNYYCAPNKVYEYVQNKMAIISNNIPFLKNFIGQYNVGLTLEDISEESIKRSIDEIVESRISESMSDDIGQTFVWEHQTPQIKSLLDVI